MFWHNNSGKDGNSAVSFLTSEVFIWVCCGIAVLWILLEFLTQISFLGWVETITWMAAVLFPAYNILLADVHAEKLNHWFGSLILSAGLLIPTKGLFLITEGSWSLALNFLVDFMFICTMVYFQVIMQ